MNSQQKEVQTNICFESKLAKLIPFVAKNNKTQNNKAEVKQKL